MNNSNEFKNGKLIGAIVIFLLYALPILTINLLDSKPFNLIQQNHKVIEYK